MRLPTASVAIGVFLFAVAAIFVAMAIKMRIDAGPAEGEAAMLFVLVTWALPFAIAGSVAVVWRRRARQAP